MMVKIRLRFGKDVGVGSSLAVKIVWSAPAGTDG
jgi:hypothetical protein